MHVCVHINQDTYLISLQVKHAQVLISRHVSRDTGFETHGSMTAFQSKTHASINTQISRHTFRETHALHTFQDTHHVRSHINTYMPRHTCQVQERHAFQSKTHITLLTNTHVEHTNKQTNKANTVNKKTHIYLLQITNFKTPFKTHASSIKTHALAHTSFKTHLSRQTFQDLHFKTHIARQGQIYFYLSRQ